MTLMDNELKEEMKTQAKAISQKLRADGRLNGQMTLADIERTVLSAGQQFQAALTEAAIEATEIEGERIRPYCTKCGSKMRHQGYRKRQIVTETGEVVLRRAYYLCESCGEGFFPPG
jgi:predicted GNAT family acetyltransferase